MDQVSVVHAGQLAAGTFGSVLVSARRSCVMKGIDVELGVARNSNGVKLRPDGVAAVRRCFLNCRRSRRRACDGALR